MAISSPVTFAKLLEDAVNEPGIISSAYSAFYNYSLGNQLLAWAQCLARGIHPGPIATFPKWKELGRYVRKGEKAIMLCQPVTVKRSVETEQREEQAIAFTRFVYKAHWFVLAQTEGQPLPDPTKPEWDKEEALAALNVQETGFEALNGNVMGYARERTIAINPVNPMPWKTRFHELAHVLLGHTAEGTEHSDREVTPRNLKECEAESVALLCCAALNMPGVEFSRGYIQNWWGPGNPIPERAAQRILKVADQILKAGTAQTEALS
jgi:antirestriction protein ArdC